VVAAINFFGAFCASDATRRLLRNPAFVGDAEIDEAPREATANPDFNVVKPYGESGEI
jgi:hypothetical protein